MALTPAQQTRLENFLDSARTKLVTIQTAYRATHSNFWQGRRQILGSMVFSDHPTDQLESWADVGIASLADLPDITGIEDLSIHISCYDGEGGKGWVVILDITRNAVTYRRVFNAGPEDRSQGWTEVPVSGLN